MSGQYFSLETVISEIYAKFPIRMMLSPNSTHDVCMVFILSEWSLDYLAISTLCCNEALDLDTIATSSANAGQVNM